MVEIESNPSETDPVEESRMTLGEHLDELRVRLIRATIAILVIFCVAWAFRHTLDEWSQRPYHQARLRLNPIIAERAAEAVAEDPSVWEEWYTEEPEEGSESPPLKEGVLIPKRMKGDTAAMGFIYYMKVCLYFSLFFGGPILLWEMWQFVAAGLYRNERKVVRLYFPFSASLFLGGVVFGYFVMVPNALYFLALQTVTSIQWYQSINGYWTFLLNLTLALGAVFQLPVIMMALAKLDLVRPATFARYRGHMLIGALLVAAIVTPPDPITQLLMAIPIAVLYEAGIWIGRAVHEPSVPAE